MTNFYMTGYLDYELGIFGNNDPKVKVLKNYLNKEIIYLLEQGIDWLFFTGKAGVEYYAFQEAIKLKTSYKELRLALLLPYEDFGSNFSNTRQIMLSDYKNQADFVASISKKPYEGIYQLKYHTKFILEHTVGSWLLYDEFELKGKSEYFYRDLLTYQQRNPEYKILIQTFDDLNQSLTDF